MKLFISLLSLGTTAGGVFAGTLQQNVLKTEKPYIDKLFHEIEKDIRDFSNRNPLTKEEAKKIKEVPDSSSGSDSVSRNKRDTENDEKAESKNTLGVWTDIWVGLLGDYIQSLWTTKNMTLYTTIDEKSRNFSEQEKQEAIKKADDANKEEKERFGDKLSNKKKEIENIYEKMKTFVLKIKIPKEYEYYSSGQQDCPYEHHIKEILEKSE